MYLGALAVEYHIRIQFYIVHDLPGRVCYNHYTRWDESNWIYGCHPGFFLVLGGLATTYLAINMVSDHFHTPGLVNGFSRMMKEASDHFDMIYEKGNPNYMDLPGFSVLVGGMWIVNLNYWGCNQYIVQRALGADLKTARSGILFAAFLKLMMPVIVVLPGIAAYVLHQQECSDGNDRRQ